MWFDQDAYALRCEWGPAGIAALAPCSDVIVLVDVLSFSTCVDVALSRGARVYPYRWRDTSARDFAVSVGAVLAGPRSHEEISLSPASLRQLPPGRASCCPHRMGRPFHGSRIATSAHRCLRNAAAVARAAQAYGPRIGVVPAGVGRRVQTRCTLESLRHRAEHADAGRPRDVHRINHFRVPRARSACD